MTEPTSSLAAMRIVRGHPDDLELAALVAGLAASASEEASVPVVPDAWADRSRLLRGAPHRTGSDAWRWSLRS